MKAVSDVISPLSGEVLEVNQAVVDAPETVNDDPYGEGWLDPDPAVRPVARSTTCSTPTRTARTSPSSELPLASPTATARRCSRRSASRRSTSSSSRCPRGSGSDGQLDLEPALSEAELVRHLEELAARNAHTGVELSFLGAGIYDHYVPAVVDAMLAARRVPDGVHAVPARDEPGRPPGDLRVPDRDLRAHRDGRLERVRLRRHDRRRRRVLHREARDRPLEGRARGGGQPAGASGREDLRARLRPRGRRGAAPRAARPIRTSSDAPPRTPRA